MPDCCPSHSEAPLDNRGNRVSTHSVSIPLDPEEDYGRGAYSPDRPNPNQPDPEVAIRRRQRRALRAVSARILYKEAVHRCGRHISPDFVPDPGHGLRKISYADIKLADGRAFMANVVTCGSVWHCPVCAAKIAEGRAQDVEDVVTAHEKAGGSVYHAVFTIPHGKFDACADLKQAVSKSWQKLQQGRAWKEIKERAGFVGSIRALEVTHGGNGWHPHIHVLFFLSGNDAKAMRAGRAFGEEVFRRWAGIVERSGFGKCSKRAFRFDRAWTAKEAGKYVSKWGSAEELTKAHMKSAGSTQRSPWQILKDIEEYESPDDIRLFKEYCAAFKGARQLTYSRGLRELYAEEEAPDEDLANAEPVDAVTVARVDEQGFKIVRDRELEDTLLEAVERSGARGIWEFCERYQIPPWHFHFLDWKDPPQCQIEPWPW